MKKKHLPVPVILLLIIGLIIAAWFLIRSAPGKTEKSLAVSGTIEAIDVSIAPEVNGKVLDVYYDEGDLVRAGDLIFKLDPGLLEAQRAVAEQNLNLTKAALSSAEAQKVLVQNTVELESKSTRTSGWFSDDPEGFENLAGTFSQSELIAAANAEIENALKARDKLLESLKTLLDVPAAADFKKAEINLLSARSAYKTTKQVLDMALLTTNAEMIEAAENSNDAAMTAFDDAKSTYDKLKKEKNAKKIIKTRVKLSVAEERVQVARDDLLKLQFGEESARLYAAQQTVEQAKVAVAQAEAQLALINVQVAKLSVASPVNGTVITRSIQPGEVIPAGATCVVLADLEKLELTVYIPEDEYGKISLGQKASIAVDSFPEEVFYAEVINIASEAEYTPRNVQTVEGRKTTVFAIKLRIEDPSRRLRPGMPADVTFIE